MTAGHGWGGGWASRMGPEENDVGATRPTHLRRKGGSAGRCFRFEGEGIRQHLGRKGGSAAASCTDQAIRPSFQSLNSNSLKRESEREIEFKLQSLNSNSFMVLRPVQTRPSDLAAAGFPSTGARHGTGSRVRVL